MIHHRKRTKFAFLLSMLGIAVLVVSTNAFLRQKKNEDPTNQTAVDSSTPPTTVSDNSTTTAAAVSGNDTATPPTQPTSEEVTAANPPAEVAGSEVVFPGGPKLIVPTPWVYSYSLENGTEVLNFGTQQFSESNPYSAALKADASGYFGPETVAPTEAIGPQSNEQKITLTDGSEAVVRTFSADIEGSVLDQLVATVPWDGRIYSAIFYTSANNTDQIERFSQLIKTVTKP